MRACLVIYRLPPGVVPREADQRASAGGLQRQSGRNSRLSESGLRGAHGRNAARHDRRLRSASPVNAPSESMVHYTVAVQSKLSLTEGSIPRALLVFALPILFGNVLQSVNGSVNAVWVGKC